MITICRFAPDELEAVDPLGRTPLSAMATQCWRGPAYIEAMQLAGLGDKTH